MTKYIFSLLIRHIRKHKLSFYVNILGLSLALTASMFILYFVNDELKYDQHFPNKEKVVRFCEQEKKTGKISAIMPGIFLTKVMMYSPLVEKGFRIEEEGETAFFIGEKKYIGKFYYADNEISDMLSLTFIKGDKNNALKEPFTIILTEGAALKYFGNNDAVGRVIKTKNGRDYKVTGIIKDLPVQTHIRPEIIASIISQNAISPRLLNDASLSGCYIYLKIKESASVQETEKSMNEFLEKSDPEIAKYVKLVLEPLNRIYLYSAETKWDIAQHGDSGLVKSFIFIIILIMFMAAFNLSNMLTAFLKMRQKETSVKILLGANKKSLVYYLICETIVYIILSSSISVIFIALARNAFNNLTGKEFTMASLLEHNMIIYMNISACLILLLAAAYPAFIIIKYSSLKRIKDGAGLFIFKMGNTEVKFRHVVTCFQYIVTIVLLVSAIIVCRQLEYSQNKNLGFKKEQLIEIAGLYSDKAYSIYTNYKNALLKNPSIVSVSAATNVPGENINNYTNVWIASGQKSEQVHCGQIAVDYDLFKTWGTNVIMARFFAGDEY